MGKKHYRVLREAVSELMDDNSPPIRDSHIELIGEWKLADYH